MRAIAERETAVAREQQRRNAAVEAQLSTDVAQSRNAAERAEAQRRADISRQRIAEQTAQTVAPPVTWAGNANGAAQAVGPTQVAGRSNCQQVREIAVIRGEEVRQTATFCRDQNSGNMVRV